MIIIAPSARALVVSAARLGISPHVIDAFADEDTALLSNTLNQVTYTDSKGFDKNELISAIQSLSFRTPIILPCGGVEADPEILAILSMREGYLGNSARTVYQCKQPAYFFPLLDRLNIRYPDVYQNASDIGDTPCLLKRIGGTGGSHIRWFSAQEKRVSKGHYIQRFISGRSISVVFLANGEHCEIVGFNEHILGGGVQPFCFTGAISLPVMPQGVYRYVLESLRKLIPQLSLYGLCGMDMIINEEGVFVLEINPRPPASFELHEHQHAMLDWHIQACQGTLPQLKKQEIKQYHAMFHIYVDMPLFFSGSFDWPSWVANRPCTNTLIKAGVPICTIFSSSTTRQQTLDELFRRRHCMNRRFRSMQYQKK